MRPRTIWLELVREREFAGADALKLVLRHEAFPGLQFDIRRTTKGAEAWLVYGKDGRSRSLFVEVENPQTPENTA